MNCFLIRLFPNLIENLNPDVPNNFQMILNPVVPKSVNLFLIRLFLIQENLNPVVPIMKMIPNPVVPKSVNLFINPVVPKTDS